MFFYIKKNKYTLLIFLFCLFAYSCNKKPLKNNKNEDKKVDNVINNLNISGYENNTPKFLLNSKKAYIENDNLIKANDTTLKIFNKDKIISEIISKHSIYDKEKKIIESTNSNIKLKDDFLIISKSIVYKEKENNIYMKNNIFIYGKNNIKSSESILINNNKLIMKKVSARFNF